MPMILPIETRDHAHDLVIVVLDAANVERMSQADPVEVTIKESNRTLVNPTILICREEITPELEAKFVRWAKDRDIGAILTYLKRGWTVLPGDGAPNQNISRPETPP